MTDNDIIKALECCKDNYCKSCPRLYCGDEVVECRAVLMEITLDLINRQKAEIERLEKANERFAKDFDSYYATVKSQAAKEFAERLCEGRLSNDPVVIAAKVELDEGGWKMTNCKECWWAGKPIECPADYDIDTKECKNFKPIAIKKKRMRRNKRYITVIGNRY